MLEILTLDDIGQCFALLKFIALEGSTIIENRFSTMETEPERVWQDDILFEWGTYNTTGPQIKQNDNARGDKQME